MVKLDKIYTKGGDGGKTSLGDGSRVPKYALRVHAQGDIDETNAAIGLARRHAAGDEPDAVLGRVQNDLFDLGADVTRPGSDPEDGNLRIRPAQVARLEREIDAFNEALPALTSFVLRGGGDFGAALHFACTVCRRAERSLCALAAEEDVNPHGLAFLNRLVWEPGGNAE